MTHGQRMNRRCNRCGYEWSSIKEHPQRCPDCGSYRWNEKPLVYECGKCRYTWFARTDNHPMRCPNCKTRIWRSGSERTLPRIDETSPDETAREIMRLYNGGTGCISIAKERNLTFSKVIETVRKESGNGPVRMR